MRRFDGVTPKINAAVCWAGVDWWKLATIATVASNKMNSLWQTT
jgi:hypothetical protein